MSWFETFRAASSVMPLMISVSADEDAIAEPHPKVWKRASRIVSVSVSTFSISRRASPQAIDPISPTALASGRGPALRGWKK